MRKTLLLTLLALLGMTQAVAQEYEYVPFVREGVKWVYRVQIQDEYIDDDDVGHVSYENHYYNLEFKGDTVINGKVYKAMHMYSGDAINEENDTIPVYMREEDKIVYAIVPDGKFYDICPINIGDNSEVNSSLQNGEEFILYDFNDPVTFCYNNLWYYKYYVDNGGNPYKFTDMITVNGHKAKRYVFCCRDEYCFVEGIGYDGIRYGYTLAYLYDYFPNTPVTYHLSHVIEDGKIIYRSEGEINTDPNDRYLPIARSDVKWVNEQVTVSDGVTTCYYYSYEFKPVGNAAGYYNCYCTSEDVMNPFIDKVVSQGMESILGFHCINNQMLKPYQDNGENMIDFEHSGGQNYILYEFDKSDISSYCLLNYYIEFQKGDLLNRENFVQVEPLTIEGVTCSRYAYISEQGDTLCYVVEGIGFDSYDMGDLLTPFTRRPDPTADYQEYCGLSHVVKDGQIIYKGMRYREGVQTGINEVVADQPRGVVDDNYYNLMGQAVGKDVPSTPGIYIHNGKKIVVR